MTRRLIATMRVAVVVLLAALLLPVPLHESEGGEESYRAFLESAGSILGTFGYLLSQAERCRRFGSTTDIQAMEAAWKRWATKNDAPFTQVRDKVYQVAERMGGVPEAQRVSEELQQMILQFGAAAANDAVDASAAKLICKLTAEILDDGSRDVLSRHRGEYEFVMGF